MYNVKARISSPVGGNERTVTPWEVAEQLDDEGNKLVKLLAAIPDEHHCDVEQKMRQAVVALRSAANAVRATGRRQRYTEDCISEG